MATDEDAGRRGRGAGSRGSKVYESLLERMRRGEIGPGTRMREDEVATLLGVSRTPVREALGRLQARGLVDSSGGGWTVVELSRSRIIELYAMRTMLEGAAARFAAENAASGEIASLKHIAGLFARYRGDPAKLAEMNVTFHGAIYEAAHNRYLMRMVQDLNDSLALLPNTTFAVPGRSEAAESEHACILVAIERRNPDEAEQAARHHIGQALAARMELLFS